MKVNKVCWWGLLVYCTWLGSPLHFVEACLQTVCALGRGALV